jgi:hypothetical protein
MSTLVYSRSIATLATKVGEFEIILLKNPKQQLGDLEHEKLELLLDEIHSATADGFETPLEKKSKEGIKNHVLGVDMLAIVYHHEKLCGFASAKISDTLFYLHGIAISKMSKGLGLGETVLSTMLESGPYEQLAFTTQNPIMYLLARKFTRTMYPSPKQSVIPEKIREQARKLLMGRRGVLNEHTLTIENLYSSCLYPHIPTVSDSDVSDWFSTQLRINENRTTCDGFIFIGEL